MTENTSRKDIWEAAGYAGLALGLASTIYMYIDNTLASSEISTGIATLGNLILWMAKFVGCIFLMKFFMKKFCTAHPEATKKEVYHMGVATALLSAFFFASMQYIDMSYISTEFYSAQYQLALQQYSSVMDSNSLNTMKEFIENVPIYTFVWTLIYCTAYGAVLSSILSRNITEKDPFADYKPE